MTQEEFGAAGILIPFIQLLQGVVTFGLPISLLKYYSDYPNKIGVINFNILVSYFVLVACYCFIAFLAQQIGLIGDLRIGDYDIESIFYLVLFALILSSTVQIVLQKYQALNSAKKFVLINSLSKIGLILLLFIAVIFRSTPLKAITLVYIILINGLFFSILSIIVLIRESSRELDKVMLYRFFIIGLPLFINGISSYILQMNGRFILENEVGIEAVAAYSFLYSISQIIFLAITIYNRLFLPDLFTVLAKGGEDVKEYINRNLNYSTKIISYISVMFLPVGMIVISTYKNVAYDSYIIYLPYLVMIYIPYNLYLVSTNYLAYIEKTYLTLVISVVTGIFSILCNIFIIKALGIVGMFISQVFFQFVFAILTSFFMKDKSWRNIIDYRRYFTQILLPIGLLLGIGLLDALVFEVYPLIWIVFGVITAVTLFITIRRNSYKVIL